MTLVDLATPVLERASLVSTSRRRSAAPLLSMVANDNPDIR